MIKNVIFDYGKVLVDYSLQNLYDPVFDDKEEEMWFIENVVSLEFHNQLDLGRPTAECVAEWQAKFPKYKRELALYDSDYMRLMGDEIPGMRQLLANLKQRGLKLFGLSNWGREKFSIVRRNYPIFDLIDGEVVSGDVHVIKPDPHIFELLCEKYSLIPAECVFTDDRPSNVDAAVSFGMKGIVFSNAQQLEKDLSWLTDETP